MITLTRRALRGRDPRIDQTRARLDRLETEARERLDRLGAGAAEVIHLHRAYLRATGQEQAFASFCAGHAEAMSATIPRQRKPFRVGGIVAEPGRRLGPEHRHE